MASLLGSIAKEGGRALRDYTMLNIQNNMQNERMEQNQEFQRGMAQEARQFRQQETQADRKFRMELEQQRQAATADLRTRLTDLQGQVEQQKMGAERQGELSDRAFERYKMIEKRYQERKSALSTDPISGNPRPVPPEAQDQLLQSYLADLQQLEVDYGQEPLQRAGIYGTVQQAKGALEDLNQPQGGQGTGQQSQPQGADIPGLADQLDGQGRQPQPGGRSVNPRGGLLQGAMPQQRTTDLEKNPLGYGY